MPEVSRETQPQGLDFSGLTDAQQRVLTFQGWAPGSKLLRQPRPQTMHKLLQRGLVTEREVWVCGVTVKAYDVPVAVHAAWCARCAEAAV